MNYAREPRYNCISICDVNCTFPPNRPCKGEGEWFLFGLHTGLTSPPGQYRPSLEQALAAAIELKGDGIFNVISSLTQRMWQMYVQSQTTSTTFSKCTSLTWSTRAMHWRILQQQNGLCQFKQWIMLKTLAHKEIPACRKLVQQEASGSAAARPGRRHRLVVGHGPGVDPCTKALHV